jgi:hypothetical protein
VTAKKAPAAKKVHYFGSAMALENILAIHELAIHEHIL